MSRFAVRVMGQMLEFRDAESIEIVRESMREAGVSRAAIYMPGSAPGEWDELDGATLKADDKGVSQ